MLKGLKRYFFLSFALLIGLSMANYFVAKSSYNEAIKAYSVKAAKADHAVQLALAANNASLAMANETNIAAFTGSAEHKKLKIAADEAAGKAFDEMKAEVGKLPNTKDIVEKIELASTQDDKVCNPLEDKAIELAMTGHLAESTKLVNEQYVPARSKLESLIKDSIDALKAYAKTQNDEGKAITAHAEQVGLLAQIALVVSALWLGWWLSGRISNPIKAASNGLSQLASSDLPALMYALEAQAEGNLTATFESEIQPLTYSKADEIGFMTTQFNNMVDQMKQTSTVFNTAQGRLTELVNAVKAQATEIRTTSGSLVVASEQNDEASRSIQSSMQVVSEATNETAKTSESLARSSEQLAQSAVNADHGVGQLIASIEDVKARSEAQQQTTRAAEEVVETSQQAMLETINRMSTIRDEVLRGATQIKDLGAKQQRIGAIVVTIEEIAEQTNLLALNAAIEAARAGEHGRGFSVVADEVRKLAERASQSTKEISSLINELSKGVDQAILAMETSTNEVEEGAKSGEGAHKALNAISQTIAEVGTAAEAVIQVVDEMVANSGIVKASIDEVSTNSESNAAGAQELTATNQEVAASAQDVLHTVNSQIELAEQTHVFSQELQGISAQLLELTNQFETGSRARTPDVGMGKAA